MLLPGLEEAAYRIAGEALHNVARHAQASTCEVTLVQPDSLEMRIADDGVGVPDPSPNGVGLHSDAQTRHGTRWHLPRLRTTEPQRHARTGAAATRWAPVTIRVVLADDHPMFRYGLRAVLDQADGIEVLGEAEDGEAEDGEALLTLVDDLAPDVVLTDLTMSGVDGVAVIGALSRRHPGLPVLALTMHADDVHVRAALRAGARGYLLKGADGVAIARAVEMVASGQDVFDPSVTARMVTSYAGGQDAGPAIFPDLTPRENDVLRLLASGCGNHEIARRLGLAEKTIRNITSSILLKLAVPDRTRAALRARPRAWAPRRSRSTLASGLTPTGWNLMYSGRTGNSGHRKWRSPRE